MDDGRLDRLEQALMRAGRARRGVVADDFTAGVMRAVRNLPSRRLAFGDLFGLAARRFAPVGAIAATATFGYAQIMERVFNQALVSLSLHGGSSALSLAGLMP
ncbi:hypothetical protein SAMN04488503_1400 [Humidesulfovibrio mexicanus]|uniref:Uncharacterized protein n=1 Tax=Humidesulfovibrio mexicanus TaxID=147047 RepID=A0A238ZAS3_9BACT|nr:hypothetical protein [Humidesulfovibrio mexicanus]SNR80645.1 hypothetical protein SAMN04488503_1400 [Humidesulfovibrio mexicanus]